MLGQEGDAPVEFYEEYGRSSFLKMLQQQLETAREDAKRVKLT